MKYRNTFLKALIAIAALAAPFTVQAQSAIQEDFTGTTTTNPWWFFNGACLTSGTLTGVEPTVNSSGVITSNGQVPGCSTIASSYYNKTSGEVLVGGKNGVAGGTTTTLPDPVTNGALRFTNGAPYGFSENGGIVSTTPFPTGQGVAVTFKTVTYRGNSGGAGGDGADGISFFLMDASKLNTSAITGVASGDGNGLGAWGGSLGYTCSNSNPPYNGLTGGYVAVGIDEYGNFLNGITNTLGETGTSATGDNTASGGGYQPGRIGMRGAGNVSWLTLNGAYGGASNPGATKPWYPSSLATSCANAGGTYSSASKSCVNCSNGGTYNSGTNSCSTTSCSTGTYNAGANACESCSAGTYSLATNLCIHICPAGWAYQSGPNNCKKGGLTQPATTAPPTASATQSSSLSNAGNPDSFYAVQNTCRNGLLYNYATANGPVSVGATSLTNAVNTGNASATPAIAPILDYTAIPGAYVVLPSTVKIANESAMKRGDATPIFYQLKISQNGRLSLAYATCPPGSNSGCSAFSSVITGQDITTSNGPLPANFLFGFAGSTGGANNIHEILCFRADPATSASSSAGASEKQSAKLENGIQAYFAYYNPSNGWTGRVTASSLGFDGFGNVVIGSTPNWDASCVLTGVPSGSTCATTGQAGLVNPQNPDTGRSILSWDGSTGVAFRYANLSAGQQTAIDSGDSGISGLVCNATTAYSTADRVNFLRGTRSCEVNSSGVGEFRRRRSVLADVMDSSPIWVGMPTAPYTASWKDRLSSSDPLSENASGATTYPQFVANNTQRTQVVYVGANDGLLHGFRSGFYDLTNSACTSANPPATCFTNNDGLELLAYMPASVVSTIHSATAAVDYSNTQYGHNYFVNATPGTGDLFYGNSWHTWLVSGLGAGGKAIFALDITNPGTTTTSGSSGGNFAESNAASLVMGEWTSANITCSGNATCGQSLGNTFGTPQIRRLHNGEWAFIFGNGYGSATGDAGIFVGVVNSPASGNPTVTFYYLSAGAGTAPNNGIAYVTPADLDGDHMTDYVYAGDLKGNLWRFDLTSATETMWAVTPGPLFTTTTNQPITTAIVAASGAATPGGVQQLMLLFGTGQKTGITNTTGTTYAPNGQSLYGVWDWNMTNWNSLSAAHYLSLAAGSAGTLLQTNLQQQVVALGSSGDIDMNTTAAVCWAGSSTCSSGNNKYGWFINLPSTQEQVVFNPGLVQQAFTVNSIVPAVNTPTACTNNTDTGFTYVVNALNGGAFRQVFLPPNQLNNGAVNTNPQYTDTNAVAMQTNATGSSFVTTNATGYSYLVYETNQVQAGGSGSNLQGGTLGLNLPPNTTGHRVSWVELR